VKSRCQHLPTTVQGRKALQLQPPLLPPRLSTLSAGCAVMSVAVAASTSASCCERWAPP